MRLTLLLGFAGALAAAVPVQPGKTAWPLSLRDGIPAELPGYAAAPRDPLPDTDENEMGVYTEVSRFFQRIESPTSVRQFRLVVQDYGPGKDVTAAIKKAVEDAERMAGTEIDSIYAGIAGEHVRAMTSKGIVAVSNDEINKSDVDRANEVTYQGPVPPVDLSDEGLAAAVVQIDTADVRLPWLNIAPFGRPVVPPVYCRKAMSSTQEPRCGNKPETHLPHWPYCLNSNFGPTTRPLFLCPPRPNVLTSMSSCEARWIDGICYEHWAVAGVGWRRLCFAGF